MSEVPSTHPPDGPRVGAPVTVLQTAAPERVLSQVDAWELQDLINEARQAAIRFGRTQAGGFPWELQDGYAYTMQRVRDWIRDRTLRADQRGRACPGLYGSVAARDYHPEGSCDACTEPFDTPEEDK